MLFLPGSLQIGFDPRHGFFIQPVEEDKKGGEKRADAGEDADHKADAEQGFLGLFHIGDEAEHGQYSAGEHGGDGPAEFL